MEHNASQVYWVSLAVAGAGCIGTENPCAAIATDPKVVVILETASTGKQVGEEYVLVPRVISAGAAALAYRLAHDRHNQIQVAI